MILFLNNGDVLAEQALYRIACSSDEKDLIYYDDDKVTDVKEEAVPFFKPLIVAPFLDFFVDRELFWNIVCCKVRVYREGRITGKTLQYNREKQNL